MTNNEILQELERTRKYILQLPIPHGAVKLKEQLSELVRLKDVIVVLKNRFEGGSE